MDIRIKLYSQIKKNIFDMNLDSLLEKKDFEHQSIILNVVVSARKLLSRSSGNKSNVEVSYTKDTREILHKFKIPIDKNIDIIEDEKVAENLTIFLGDCWNIPQNRTVPFFFIRNIRISISALTNKLKFSMTMTKDQMWSTAKIL